MARFVFFIFLACAIVSFVAAVVAAMAGHWSGYLIAPFLVFFAIAAAARWIAVTRGEIDPSDWRGDI